MYSQYVYSMCIAKSCWEPDLSHPYVFVEHHITD